MAVIPLGSANTFVFTIKEGPYNFMGAGLDPVGEWHMHCHVMAHMMGSLLVVNNNQDASGPLPTGKMCPSMKMPVMVPPGEVWAISDPNNTQSGGFSWSPHSISVKKGNTVTFKIKTTGIPHTVLFDTPGSGVTGDQPDGSAQLFLLYSDYDKLRNIQELLIRVAFLRATLKLFQLKLDVLRLDMIA